ncbi:DUF3953 domain-containing protein [Paenibacillus endoradicis]|uniref:DUF3953 domain-containing protein n=1 Tax=Paenibacillus endoradicis TaxID=2972487 RepID=UPI0021590606|nr:DUF3953 domain-containing protein [Paenibacillus endoradicis]MCR8656358.1 DUF3953 domain-containing protein [Paenibacillus endoradicis]
MLKKMKFLFGLLTVIIAIYIIIDNIFYFDSSRTDKFNALPIMNFFLGLFFLVVGFSELQLKRKTYAFMSFIVSALNISVSIYMYPVFF